MPRFFSGFHRSFPSETFPSWLNRLMAGPLAWPMVILAGIASGILVAQLGLLPGLALAFLLLGLPVSFLLLRLPLLGISLTLILTFFIEFARKFTAFPAGIAMDGLTYLLFGGLLIHIAKTKDIGFARNPISLLLLIWIAYNLIQFFNPIAGSRMAWLYTVRSLAGLTLVFYIASHAIRNLQQARILVVIMVGMSLLSALYGLKQEFLGFSQGELNWLYSDPERFQLIYQWGRLRIFSFSSNPTNFGISMAFISVFALVLATGPYHWLIRLTLLGGSLLMLIAMAYAGSRTPFILLPAALLFYTILTFNKKVILAAGLIGLLGTALVMKSTSNPVLFRIQSAFRLKDSEDTIGVRMRNQEKVQPFVLAHPFGAGLGSTGVWGKRFTPDSWLASFAHDSGYVRIAVEMGWIGLLLYLGLLFVILKQAVYYYFRVRDPEIKNLYLGLSTAIFMLVVANYPQEAIVQLPMSILFYVMLALIARLKDFDPNFSSTSTIP